MAEADPQVPVAASAPDAAPTGAPDQPARPRRRWLRPLLLLIVPLLLLGIGGYFYLTSGRWVSTDNAYVQQDMVSISPDVSGRIVEVAVRENQRVKAGDLLFRIDPEPYRIALAEAEAAVAQARVQVSTLQTEVGGASVDIDAAREDVRFAQSEYDRQAELMRRGFTTRARLEQTQHALASAREAVRTAQADAAKARAALGTGGRTGGNPAALQSALAARDRAALNLERTAVRAPHDGVVSQTDRLQVGTILPSGVPALSLVSSATAWVEANFKETDLDHMSVGQPAELEFDAYPGLKARGHVASIGAGTGSEFSLLPAQNANGNWVKVTQRVPVRIAIDGTPARPMIAGLSADVAIDTGERR